MIGGEIVPAVTLVAVSVVSVRSMSVAELCAGLYRVGVVIVVRRLLQIRKSVNGCWGRSLKMSMFPLKMAKFKTLVKSLKRPKTL